MKNPDFDAAVLQVLCFTAGHAVFTTIFEAAFAESSGTNPAWFDAVIDEKPFSGIGSFGGGHQVDICGTTAVGMSGQFNLNGGKHVHEGQECFHFPGAF